MSSGIAHRHASRYFLYQCTSANPHGLSSCPILDSQFSISLVPACPIGVPRLKGTQKLLKKGQLALVFSLSRLFSAKMGFCVQIGSWAGSLRARLVPIRVTNGPREGLSRPRSDPRNRINTHPFPSAMPFRSAESLSDRQLFYG